MPEGYLDGSVNVAWWKTQLTKGEEFRKKFAREDQWDTWRKYYRGQWNSDILPSNIYFKMIRTIVPRIYFRNPSISLTASKPGIEHMLFAQLLERIDNKLIRRMKIKNQIKAMVQDAFMFGTGVGKLGYGSEFALPSGAFGNESPFGKNQELFEYNQNVFANMPWFLRTHPGNFIVPSGTIVFDDSRFCIHHIRRSLSDVKSDKRFSYTAGLKGTKVTTTAGGGKATDESKNPVEMIDLYEVRDKKFRKIFVIAPFSGENKPLYQDDDDMQVLGRLPFYTLTFNSDDEVFWGIPDSAILDPIQRELNETRTQIMRHRRLSLVKILCKANSIESSEALKMVDGSIAPIINVKGDPLTDIRFLEGSNIPDDLFKAFEFEQMDARETVGFSRNQFGEYKPGSSDTTATEAMIVRQASEIRVDERRDMIADMLVDVVEHIHQIIFNRWEDEQVIDIIGPNGIPIWVTFKPQMLKGGSYEVNIDPDTSVAETKQMRQQKAIQVFGLLNGDQLTDQVKLRRYLLHELHGTVFDDMIAIPPGLPGSQLNPMSVDQLSGVYRSAANQAQGGGKP